jgi:hypothetical protein
MTTEAIDLPDWFGPLCDEIRAELARLDGGRHDHRPVLEREAAELESKIRGWSLSLAKPDLPADVRDDIESGYAGARARIREIQAALAGEDGRAAQRDRLLDPAAALARLRRLADVLARGNVTLGNLELGRHIDRIDAFADGSVVMRTSRLGIFEGAIAELSRPGAAPAPAGATPRAKPRRRSRLRVDEPAPGGAMAPGDDQPGLDPRRFDGLDAGWFWEDPVPISGPSCWSSDNAAAVARVRRENPGWTLARLCAHFGKTAPTIRKALKLAAEGGAAGSAAPRPAGEPPTAEGEAAGA